MRVSHRFKVRRGDERPVRFSAAFEVAIAIQFRVDPSKVPELRRLLRYERLDFRRQPYGRGTSQGKRWQDRRDKELFFWGLRAARRGEPTDFAPAVYSIVSTWHGQECIRRPALRVKALPTRPTRRVRIRIRSCARRRRSANEATGPPSADADAGGDPPPPRPSLILAEAA